MDFAAYDDLGWKVHYRPISLVRVGLSAVVQKGVGQMVVGRMSHTQFCVHFSVPKNLIKNVILKRFPFLTYLS